MKFSRSLFCFNKFINVLKFLILNLENLNLVELNAQEVQEVEGGFLPLVAIGICWGLMAVSSAVALGMKHRYKV